jgi:hypothetical protein
VENHQAPKTRSTFSRHSAQHPRRTTWIFVLVGLDKAMSGQCGPSLSAEICVRPDHRTFAAFGFSLPAYESVSSFTRHMWFTQSISRQDGPSWKDFIVSWWYVSFTLMVQHTALIPVWLTLCLFALPRCRILYVAKHSGIAHLMVSWDILGFGGVLAV